MNKTINELVALTELANDDELIVYDVSEGTSKKIRKSDLKNQLAGDLIVDAVQDGNLKAVTSKAVFNKLNGIGGVVQLSFPYTTFTTGTPYGQLNCNELLTEGVWLCTAYLLCGSSWFLGDVNCTKDNVACSTFARILSSTDCRQEITFVVTIPKNMTSRLGLYIQNANTGTISSDTSYWGITCIKLANV